jgi:CRISPR-associated protein Cmr2
MTDFSVLVSRFLHDPIDKVFDIRSHERRAKEYANMLNYHDLEKTKTSDIIASCMERSFLPNDKVFQDFSEIKHPLCNGFIKAPEVDEETIQDIKTGVERVFKNYQYLDSKELFIYLWRNFQEDLIKEISIKNVEIIKYIPILPADTRIPDHSIWEHLKVSSAINSFERFQNNSFLLFTLGPVQSFISNARKTQDLFAGSFLISYLTFVAIKEVIDKYGPTSVVYPDLFKQPLVDWYLEFNKGIKLTSSASKSISYPSIPNRFVCIIPETDKEILTDLAKDLELEINNEWKAITDNILNEFEIELSEEIVEEQTKDFPTINWTFLPWKFKDEEIGIDDLDDFIDQEMRIKWKELHNFVKENGEFPPNIGFLYQLMHSSLEKSLKTVKINKRFDQTKSSEESSVNCSVCGKNRAFIKPGIGKLNVGKYISKKEKLCIPCFVKRALNKYLKSKFGEEYGELSFPSTSEIASANFKEKALKSASKEFKEFTNNLAHFTKGFSSSLPKLDPIFDDMKIENFDGELFYEENLNKETLENNNLLKTGINEDKYLMDAISSLQKLTKKIGKPSAYYALIKLDADDMGRWLSAEKLPDIEYAYNSEVWEKKLSKDFKEGLKSKRSKKILTPSIHSSISNALRIYSVEFVRNILEEEHLGKVVYSGGDDILGFVNIKDLFSVIRKLRAAFSGNVKVNNRNIEVDWENNTGFVEVDGKIKQTMGPNATLSAGVVLAHYKEPLRLVLNKVKEAERLAKREFDKNSFCIVLIRRSGELRNVISKWKYNGVDVLLELTKFGQYLHSDSEEFFSTKFTKNLRNEFSRLVDEIGVLTTSANIFKTELFRVLMRAYNGSKTGDEKRKFVHEITEKLDDLFWKMGGNLGHFLSMLEITAFINGQVS